MSEFYSGDKMKTIGEGSVDAMRDESMRRILGFIGYLYVQEISKGNYEEVMRRGVFTKTRTIAKSCNMRQPTVVKKINNYVELGYIEFNYAGGHKQGGSFIKFKNVDLHFMERDGKSDHLMRLKEWENLDLDFIQNDEAPTVKVYSCYD